VAIFASHGVGHRVSVDAKLKALNQGENFFRYFWFPVSRIG
jgi:hypothetical protein